MPKHSLPRKSTNIDMTAMCDVAFLLLTFFMLATKFKPPEAKPVVTPSSVSTQAIPEKDAFLVTIDDQGRTFLMLGEGSKRKELFTKLNAGKSLGLTDQQIAKLAEAPFIGVSHEELAGYADLSKEKKKEFRNLQGIPIMDSLNNQLRDYVYYALEANEGKQWNWIIKGDQASKYLIFKKILASFEAWNVHKFKIITKMEGVPVGSELYNLRNLGKDNSQIDD
jgi:biopolymer transport protein ExbD